MGCDVQTFSELLELNGRGIGQNIKDNQGCCKLRGYGGRRGGTTSAKSKQDNFFRVPGREWVEGEGVGRGGGDSQGQDVSSLRLNQQHYVTFNLQPHSGFCRVSAAATASSHHHITTSLHDNITLSHHIT